MTDLNPQPLPPGYVRVTAPVAVLGDLKRFQKVQAEVLRQIGCPNCHSGARLIWEEFVEFEVSQDGRVAPVRGPGAVGAGGLAAE
jgi:hypothetical protein